MLTGALVVCWYGYRPFPAESKQAEWAAWHGRWGLLMRVVGPRLAMLAIAQVLIKAAAQ